MVDCVPLRSRSLPKNLPLRSAYIIFAAMKTKILFVCLGNICRSPAADGIMRRIVRERGLAADFEIDSAGTYAGTRANCPTRACAAPPRPAATNSRIERGLSARPISRHST